MVPNTKELPTSLADAEVKQIEYGFINDATSSNLSGYYQFHDVSDKFMRVNNNYVVGPVLPTNLDATYTGAVLVEYMGNVIEFRDVIFNIDYKNRSFNTTKTQGLRAEFFIYNNLRPVSYLARHKVSITGGFEGNKVGGSVSLEVGSVDRINRLSADLHSKTMNDRRDCQQLKTASYQSFYECDGDARVHYIQEQSRIDNSVDGEFTGRADAMMIGLIGETGLVGAFAGDQIRGGFNAKPTP